MPRAWSFTCPSAAKSIRSSIGMIITQISMPDRQVDARHFQRTDRLNQRRKHLTDNDAGNDAQSHPQGEIALEGAHSVRRALCNGTLACHTMQPLTLCALAHCVPISLRRCVRATRFSLVNGRLRKSWMRFCNRL